MLGTCIKAVELLKLYFPMKMWRSIPTAGARTLSMGRNCGKLRANGCGTCVSHLGGACKEARYVRSNGHLPKKRHSCSQLQNPHQKSMARGNWPETWVEPGVKLQVRRSYG